jgi:hypothetical protein
MKKDTNDTKKNQFFNSYLPWEHYNNLENDFLGYLKYVPLKEEHYNVWSPLLVDLLNNIGSLFDSFLKNAVWSDSYKNIKDIDTLRIPERPNMNLYRTFFEKQHKFSQKTIYDLINLSQISPFSEWKDDQSPGWWISYTSIKHDRLRNQEKATLKITLNALGALFLLHVIISDTRTILVRDGFIKMVHKTEPVALLQILSSEEPLKTDQIIYVKTRLFGYVYETYPKKVADAAKISVLSSPWISGYWGERN